MRAEMARLLGLLVLCAGFAFAQEGDDSGITEDEAPAAESPEPGKSGKAAEPARTTAYPAREPGKKVATVTIRKKVYALTLPADWVLIDGDDPKSELAWEVLLPGSTKRAELLLIREEGNDPRSLPYRRAEWFRKEQPDATVEVHPKPLPRLVVRRTSNGADQMFSSVSVRNNIYTLQFACSPDDFAQAEADLFAAVRSFTAEVEIWPPIPKGYEVSEEGTWLVARAPGVTAPVAPLVKALKETEKRFRRDHGALPKGDGPIVVLVHATKAAAGKLEPRAADSEVGDFFGDEQRRRLFAVPLAKDDKDKESMLAYNAHGLLFVARYGDGRPYWLLHGQCTVAQAEVRTGKPLPSLDEGFVAWASTVKFHLLGELDELHEKDRDAWRRESFFYAAALREGKYKKQYEAFLADLAETADALGAFERNIAPIDQEDLRDSTNKYLSTRIKEEKRKHAH